MQEEQELDLTELLSSIDAREDINTTWSIEDYTLNLYVDKDIEHDSLKEQTEQAMLACSEESPIELCNVFIHSNGGDITEAFKFIDVLELLQQRIPVRTIILGNAKSAGLLISMSGTKGERYISRNSSVMSHQASLYMNNMAGRISDLAAIHEDFKKTTAAIINHYKRHTGLSRKKIERDLMAHNDTTLTSKEAIEYNLVDKLLHNYNIFRRG